MKVIEDKNIFNYDVFNEACWHYNVNKFFFILALSMLCSIVMLYNDNFTASSATVILYFVLGPFIVLVMSTIFDVLCAIVVKTALEPGALLESNFKLIFDVATKTAIESFKVFISYKKIYSTRSIIPNSFYSTSTLFFNPNSVVCFNQDYLGQTGFFVKDPYIRKPEHLM